MSKAGKSIKHRRVFIASIILTNTTVMCYHKMCCTTLPIVNLFFTTMGRAPYLINQKLYFGPNSAHPSV